jgi:Family of unknown function (DUF5677)
MKYLTTDEHREVVKRLVALAKAQQGFVHEAGAVYTSLMVCFMMHTVGAAESLLALHKQFGEEWFPATTGYLIARSLFEIDVNAHYISADPATRSRRYIDFEHVIRKNTLEAIERHRASDSSSWREGLQLKYNLEYAPRKAKIEADYDLVRSQFENAKGRRANNWAGKSIREIAIEVDHLEAYDIFYADLSAFTHVNVMLANRFLRLNEEGPMWSMRANEFDVGSVFRYTAIFMSCFLELFGKQFDLWDKDKVMVCWDFPEAEGRGEQP